jgi:hypothetical protein
MIYVLASAMQAIARLMADRTAAARSGRPEDFLALQGTDRCFAAPTYQYK